MRKDYSKLKAALIEHIGTMPFDVEFTPDDLYSVAKKLGNCSEDLTVALTYIKRLGLIEQISRRRKSMRWITKLMRVRDPKPMQKSTAKKKGGSEYLRELEEREIRASECAMRLWRAMKMPEVRA